ncbi:DUF2471 family protein [Cupriavidus necator]
MIFLETQSREFWFLTVIEALPPIIRRHRESGHLTWHLLHQIEAEVLADVAASGKHNPQVLRMMRAPAVLQYPKDERPASFVGHDVVRIVFAAIAAAWQRVD